MKMPNGQMDGWMQVRTLCLYLHRKRLPNILTTHSAKSRGLGLLTAAKNNQGEIGALVWITVTSAILNAGAAARNLEVGMRLGDPPPPHQQLGEVSKPLRRRAVKYKKSEWEFQQESG